MTNICKKIEQNVLTRAEVDTYLISDKTDIECDTEEDEAHLNITREDALNLHSASWPC